MAESNQRTARAQKASKAQKAQSGAAKAKARQEEEALLRADTFTNAPKVSRRTLTKEEREDVYKRQPLTPAYTWRMMAPGTSCGATA